MTPEVGTHATAWEVTRAPSEEVQVCELLRRPWGSIAVRRDGLTYAVTDDGFDESTGEKPKPQARDFPNCLADVRSADLAAYFETASPSSSAETGEHKRSQR